MGAGGDGKIWILKKKKKEASARLAPAPPPRGAGLPARGRSPLRVPSEPAAGHGDPAAAWSPSPGTAEPAESEPQSPYFSRPLVHGPQLLGRRAPHAGRGCRAGSPPPPPRRGRDPSCPAGAAATRGARLRGAGAWGDGCARPRFPAVTSALRRRSQGSRAEPQCRFLADVQRAVAEQLHPKAPPAGMGGGEGAPPAVFGEGAVAPRTPPPRPLSLAAGHSALGPQVRTLPGSWAGRQPFRWESC